MVYTLTFNPSIDYIAFVDDYKCGMVNRTCRELMLPGGKGINVSIVLSNLGTDTTALGFLAGSTGEVIRSLMANYSVRTDFITLSDGLSRINVKLKADVETEINGKGPHITDAALKELYGKLATLKHDDWLVLAGAVPPSLETGVYGEIMKQAKASGTKVVVDASAKLLSDSLEFSPFLIKPNNYELEEIFDCKINSDEDVVKYASLMRDMGAVNVLVSLGKDGALLLDENGDIHKREAPRGKVINTTGSGDSMVAGFIAGYIETSDYDYALSLGIACGSASAFVEGLATKEQIYKLI